jgi:hypothetical protein
VNLPIPESVARALAKVPESLIVGVVELVGRIVRSPSPGETLARALQVTAHEQAADATIDAAFAAKNRIAGTGE